MIGNFFHSEDIHPVDNQLKISSAQLRRIASLFITQLRELFGLTLPSVAMEVKLLVPHSGICEWEMEALIRRRTYRSMEQAVERLTTIIDLARRQGHLALPDGVGRKMAKSISLLEEARHWLSRARFRLAHQAAIGAYTEAAHAAQDKESISLLHYPDEHEIAIYVPHLLPVFWPLVFGLLGELLAYIGKLKFVQSRIH